MIQRNIIGKIYFHRFLTKTGSTKDVECTQAEYRALASGGSPTGSAGDTWVGSFEQQRVDSLTGILGDNEFFIDGTVVVVKLPSIGEFSVDSTKLVANDIPLSVKNEFLSKATLYKEAIKTFIP